MKNDLISIIMPAYNSASFIQQSIESVISQTYQNWELIVIDDNSKDATYSIVQAYVLKDPRIILLHNEKNSGVAMTRNNGLKRATGRYISFLDSDDLWVPEKLEKQLSYMRENNYSFTFSSYQQITADGVKKKVIRAKKKMTGKKILGDTSIGCLTVMLDKNKFGDFYMPNICHMEDNSTWQKLLSTGEIGYGIDEVLAYYRIGNDSMTKSKLFSMRKQWRVYRTYYHFDIFKSFYYYIQYGINAVIKYFF